MVRSHLAAAIELDVQPSRKSFARYGIKKNYDDQSFPHFKKRFACIRIKQITYKYTYNLRNWHLDILNNFNGDVLVILV